jgi:hypothetical protein
MKSRRKQYHDRPQRVDDDVISPSRPSRSLDHEIGYLLLSRVEVASPGRKLT